MSDKNYLFLGTPVDIFNPENQVFKDLEIWNGMRQLRYGGQIPVNIQQHTFLVMILCEVFHPNDPGLRAQCAAHDAHESYIGEIPTGFKHIIPGFEGMDERWAKAVHDHLGVPWPNPVQAKKIKVLDMLALVLEMEVLEHGSLFRLRDEAYKLYENAGSDECDQILLAAEEVILITSESSYDDINHMSLLSLIHI